MKLSEYQRSRPFFDLHSDFKVKCLTFGLYTQVSDSGSLGPLVFLFVFFGNRLVSERRRGRVVKTARLWCRKSP